MVNDGRFHHPLDELTRVFTSAVFFLGASGYITLYSYYTERFEKPSGLFLKRLFLPPAFFCPTLGAFQVEKISTLQEKAPYIKSFFDS